jgi:hypothetical protein
MEPLRHIKIDISDTFFTLKIWETNKRADTGQELLRYEFADENGNIIFNGEDYGCSPMDAIDSDDSLRGLLGYISLRPGDTDAEYFDNYTPEQMEFAETYGEELSLYALEYEENEPNMEFTNLDDWED